MTLPSNPDLILSTFANSGDKTAPPQTDPTGFVNFHDGYGADYEIDLSSGDTAAKAVEREDQNYLFNLMTSLGQFWQQMGVPPWYSTMPSGYNQGAVVGRVSTGGAWQVWRSLVNSNVVDPNLHGQTSWEYVPLNTELLSEVAMPAGGVADISPGGQTTELIQVATDFNTLLIGTWEYQTDAIANGSAHAPVAAGVSGSAAGMLEAKQWNSGSGTFNSQRYSDRNGAFFFRGATNGVWTAWTSAGSGGGTGASYSIDTGAANAVQGNATLTSGIIADNTQFWVNVSFANTGATTFSPNTTVAAVPLLGQDYLPLQGGELVVNTRILVVYRSGPNSYVLAFNGGGAIHAKTATKTTHATNAGQVQNNSLTYAVDTGAVNAIAVAFTPAITALTDGLLICVKIKALNSGSTTLNANGLGASPVLGGGGVALQGGELVANGNAIFEWNSTLASWMLVASAGGALQVGAAAQSGHAINLGAFTTALNLKANRAGDTFTGVVQVNANVGIGTVPTAAPSIGNPVNGANNLVLYNAGSIGIEMLTDNAATRTQQYAFGAAGISVFDAGMSYDTTSRQLVLRAGSTNIATLSASAIAVAGTISSSGHSFGSVAASGVTDLSKHISLFGGVVGFNITAGRVNWIAPSTNTQVMVIGGADIMTVSSTGVAINGTLSNTGLASLNTSDRRLKKNIKHAVARPVHRMIKGAGALCTFDRTDMDASGIGPMAQDVRSFDPIYAGQDEKARKVRGKKRAAKYLLIDKTGLAYEGMVWNGNETDKHAKIIKDQAKTMAEQAKLIKKQFKAISNMDKRIAKLEAIK